MRQDAVLLRTACEQALALEAAGEHGASLVRLAPWLQSADPPLDVLSLAAPLQERLGQFDEALRAYQALAARQPWQAGLENAIGRVKACQGHAADALQCFDRVLAREPRNPDALYNRGNALRLLMRREEAIEAYRAVLPLHADYARLALEEIARQQLALHDVDGARISYLQLSYVAPEALAPIGYRVSLETRRWPSDPAAVVELARTLGSRWAAQQPAVPLPPPLPRAAGQPLRVGLVSADLWTHPVGLFLLALLPSSSARSVEWVVYDSRTAEAAANDAVTQTLRAAATRWHEVAAWPDAHLARQVREDGIDVLVDLSGYTAHHRLAAFASRPAPVQLSWLGYHGTTGLPFIDGVIADWHCVPPGEEAYFTEDLLRLPHTRFAYTPREGMPALAPSPVLRHGQVTFGCFQPNQKIGPQVLAAWARIAAALPDARWHIVLGDAESDSSDWQRFRARCAAAGFAPQHLEVFGRLPYEQYLAAHADVDVMLDTFPYPGGTTTADALWMGVPTLTLSTPGMLGRQGEQILRAAGLPDWVTHSVDDYVAQAVERGRSAAQSAWAALRPGLRQKLAATPFFDGERFARDWIDTVHGFWRRRAPQGALAPPAARLMFYVPSFDRPFGGVKAIYENVAVLRRLGFRAFTYTPPGSQAGAFWAVQKHELDAWNPRPGDVVIAPEVMPADWLHDTRQTGCRLWLLVQNWAYVPASFAAAATGPSPFDGVLAVSDATEQIVRRCLPSLPCLRIPCAVASATAEALPAAPVIAYLPRKLPELAVFLRQTWPLAFPDLADVEWIELDDLPHAELLARLAQARYFVSLQHLEGFGLPALEAMAAGCLVVGFAGVGGREYARPDNGLWVPDDDGLALLETLGQALRTERRTPGCFDAQRLAARRAACRYSEAARDVALRQAFESISDSLRLAPERTP
jgi:protein O-GlcNAc transferase